jgi:hypothetical protein
MPAGIVKYAAVMTVLAGKFLGNTIPLIFEVRIVNIHRSALRRTHTAFLESMVWNPPALSWMPSPSPTVAVRFSIDPCAAALRQPFLPGQAAISAVK